MTSTLGLGRGKEKERRRRHDCDGERWGYIPGKVGLVSAEGMKRVVRKLKTIFVPRPRLPWKFNQGCSLHLILSFFLSLSLSLSLSLALSPPTSPHALKYTCKYIFVFLSIFHLFTMLASCSVELSLCAFPCWIIYPLMCAALFPLPYMPSQSAFLYQPAQWLLTCRYMSACDTEE